MIYLVGSLACSAVFAQSYKLAVARGQNIDWVSFASFAMSALLLAGVQTVSMSTLVLPAVGLGVVYGLAGGFAQLTFFRALRYGEMSVSWTIVQLSTLIPILASIFYWHEHPTTLQALAICGMILAIVLMGNVEFRLVRQPLAWAAWMALSYVSSGLSGVCMKRLESDLPAQAEVTFLLTGYLVSIVLTLPLVYGHSPGRRELAVGAVRGFAILAANWLVLRAIQVLPGYIVFSVYGAAGVTLNVLLAILIWKERPRIWAYAGILLAILSIAVFTL